MSEAKSNLKDMFRGQVTALTLSSSFVSPLTLVDIKQETYFMNKIPDGKLMEDQIWWWWTQDGQFSED